MLLVDGQALAGTYQVYPSSYDKDRHGRATMRYSNKHSGDVLMLGVGLGRSLKREGS